MANMYMNDSYSAVRQADGKVLGRVRAVVKSATPQAGVKDFRFFVDPVSHWQIWSPFSGIASCRLHRHSAITGTLCWMIW